MMETRRLSVEYWKGPRRLVPEERVSLVSCSTGYESIRRLWCEEGALTGRKVTSSHSLLWSAHQHETPPKVGIVPKGRRELARLWRGTDALDWKLVRWEKLVQIRSSSPKLTPLLDLSKKVRPQRIAIPT